MRHIYRYSRQINVRNQDNWETPSVSGVEEIWCDGQKQVNYLNDQEVYQILHDLETPFYRLTDGMTDLSNFDIDPWSQWIETDTIPTRIRHLNPNEVVISDLQDSNRKPWQTKVSKIGKLAQQKISKLARKVQRIPDALSAAWQTLNRPE